MQTLQSASQFYNSQKKSYRYPYIQSGQYFSLMFKNLSNYNPTPDTLFKLQSFSRPSTTIIKRKVRKTCDPKVSNDYHTHKYLLPHKNPSNKILRSTSMVNAKSKYQNHMKKSKQLHSVLQKENILFQIEKQNKKLNEQYSIYKRLQQRLQKKQRQSYKKLLTLKKSGQEKKQYLGFIVKKDVDSAYSRTLYGIKMQHTNSSSRNQTVSPLPSNLVNSISSQISYLKNQFSKNQKAIDDMKKTKKYTRFLECIQETNIFKEQLHQTKQKLHQIKLQIFNLKRVKKQQNHKKIKRILLDTKIENKIQEENIRIYNKIQETNDQFQKVNGKKLGLKKKRNQLIKEVKAILHGEDALGLKYKGMIEKYCKGRGIFQWNWIKELLDKSLNQQEATQKASQVENLQIQKKKIHISFYKKRLLKIFFFGSSLTPITEILQT